MSFPGDAFLRMPRVTFVNLRTGEGLEFPFSPTGFTEQVVVNWARQTVVGMSHSQLQYGNTENYAIRGIEFEFAGATIRDLGGAPDSNQVNGSRLDRNLDARLFLMSLCYAHEGATGVRDGAPPRVLFVWPTLISITCVIANLQIRHRSFNRAGQSISFVASMDLEEVRDTRLFAEDVRVSGTRRSSQASEEIGDAATGDPNDAA